jgi:hypothetical protein
MGDDVVAEEIEVGATGELPSLRASEQLAVEFTGAVEIVHSERKMKQRFQCHDVLL